MNIELVEDGENYGVVIYIPQYIESCVLFDKASKNIRLVYNNTNYEYVVTLYSDTNTYINFLAHTTTIESIFNNDEHFEWRYAQKIQNKNNYTVVLNSKLFVKGIVRKVLKDEKIEYSKELKLDHTIDTYQNKCTIPNDEVCNTIVGFIKDIALYKEYNSVNDTKIIKHKHDIIKLKESLNNVSNKTIEINKLNIDISERQTKLEQSKHDIFVSCIVLCFVCALVLLEYFYKWWYELH